ncbi:MAG: hypothetical protein E7337_16565 [Clostridiales bacterium]|nr:hypothetical protein [Clostridiales bacterium]
MLITIEGWKYLLELTSDRMIRVRHVVTPADGGYGRNVDVLLSAEYLRTHTIEEFYDDIASENTHPAPEYIHREQEIEAIREMFHLHQITHMPSHDRPRDNKLLDTAEILRRLGAPTDHAMTEKTKPVPSEVKAAHGSTRPAQPLMQECRERTYLGFELKDNNTRVFTAGKCTDAEIVDALVKIYRSNRSRYNDRMWYVVGVESLPNHDLKAIREAIRKKCPGMNLAFRGNVSCLWEGEPSYDTNDIPKFRWQDPQDKSLYETYELYEGDSHDGSESYYSILTKRCRRK